MERGRQEFFTKVREAVKGAKMGEKDEWMELWQKFWEGERHKWIKEAEKQTTQGNETAEAADIGELFGDNDEMCALWDPEEREKHQITLV